MNGVERIAKERQRQIDDECFDKDHDESHVDGELPMAAVCYAAASAATPVYYMRGSELGGFEFNDPWPEDWDARWDKRPRNRMNELKKPTPAQRIRMLEKAGALIAAEIDRLLNAGIAK